jgi:fibronectin type 3 domain-containing protein
MKTYTINGRSFRVSKKSFAKAISQACKFELLENRVLMSSTLHSTPTTAPVSLTAIAGSPTSVALHWTDKDTTATGYYVLRSTGSTFSQVAKLTSGTATTFVDTTVAAHTGYSYEVEAFSASNSSPVSTTASVTTPFALPVAPATLAATINGPTSISLKWTDKDSTATGYVILRADSTNFAQVGKLTTGTASTFTDATAVAGHKYNYEIEAVNPAGSSVASNVVAVTTPVPMPVIPISLTATLNSNNAVSLRWTESDTTVNGFVLLRSDGSTFSQIGKLTSGATTTFTDTTSLPGHNYTYEVESVNVTGTSAASKTAAVSMPMVTPAGVAVSMTSYGVRLTWTDGDSRATGYNILRSTDGVHFTNMVNLMPGTANNFTDGTVTLGQNYSYQVQAHTASLTSAASNVATVKASLAAPTGLTATAGATTIALAWIESDSTATGFLVFRSTDNKTFSKVATVTSASTKTFTDTAVTAGQTYYYQVQATDNLFASVVSNVASAHTTPAPSPAPSTNGVTLTTRFGNELVITAAGTADSVSVSESGTTLTIVADGQTTTQPAPAAGLFIYARGGTDTVTVAGSVTTTTTVDTIDGANDIITNSAPNANVWCDSTDTVTGGIIHKVASFAAGVSKALGAALANPTDGGATVTDKASLFGTGPVAGDVNQGEVGDCYFLASLAAFAGTKPSVLTNSAVDLGDGTYAVQFYNGSGQPIFVRVSDAFSSGPFNGFMYAHPGTSGTTWAMVFEKAFCYFRTGANTFNSINGGWMGEVYSDLGVNSTNFVPSSSSDANLFATLSADLAAGRTVTVACFNGPNMVNDHAYTLVGVTTDSNGVHHYIVRNPWGVAGDSLENSQGYATLTYAQFVANFGEGVIANA